jgi:hypothetical protein
VTAGRSPRARIVMKGRAMPADELGNKRHELP